MVTHCVGRAWTSPGWNSRTGAEASVDALERLVAARYERRGREVWGLARRLGASDEEAADIVQEAYLRLWRELATGAPIQDADAWVFRVAYRLVMDHHRLGRRVRDLVGRLTDGARRTAVLEVDDALSLWPLVDRLPAGSGRRSTCATGPTCRSTRSERSWASRRLPQGPMRAAEPSACATSSPPTEATMHSDEIERRLRLAAPDEPAVLPQLILTATGSLGAIRGRPPGDRGSQRAGLLSPTALVAVLVLLALAIGVAVTGALRLQRVDKPLGADDVYAGHGVAVDYPEGWVRLTPWDPLGQSTAFTALIVSSTGVDGCTVDELPSDPGNGAAEIYPSLDPGAAVSIAYSGVEDHIFACVVERPLADGEVRVVVSEGYPQRIGVGPIESFDPEAWFGTGAQLGGMSLPTEADGWTERIDGAPAKLVVSHEQQAIGADEVRTWAIHAPGDLGRVWYVRAGLRGDDLAPLRVQADDIARSLRFATQPPELDPDQLDAALATEIDRADRERRAWSGSKMFGCFPRSAGERDVVLEYGPDGPLLQPLSVTCRTTVEATAIRLWHATIGASWVAADGHPAGEATWELYFGGASAMGSFGEVHVDRLPGSIGELPPPLDGPLTVPAGSIVEVLSPGVDQTRDPIQAMWQAGSNEFGDRVVYDALPGRRFAVVDGPVTHVGVDWYLVEVSQGPGQYPIEHAWLPSSDGTRPLVRVVEPDCPSGAGLDDLLYLQPAERVECFSDRDLVLDPTILATAEHFDGGVQGTPSWLAPDTRWRLFGAGGPEGLEPGLPVAISPTIGDLAPTGTWLRVTGHFADPAASTCTRVPPEDWGTGPEAPEFQAARCRELFVVTAVEPRDAP